jgi:uncharacterized protein YjbI with pentapeptide repeats
VKTVAAVARALLLLVLVVGALLPAGTAAQQAPQSAAPTAACRFVGGFEALREQIAALEGQDEAGSCLEDERPAAGGAVTQRTAQGVFLWRPADDVTSFTHARTTWTQGPGGLEKHDNAAEVPWDVQATFGFAPGIDYLFLVQAPGGTLVPKPGAEADRYVVTLEKPEPTMEWFANRPERLAGHNTLLNFVRAWELLGFGEDPPNTAIALTEGADENQDTLIVQMFAPALDAARGTLTFEARVLRDDEAHAFAYYAGKADRALPARFGPVSLFVDSAAVPTGPQVVNGCTIAPNAQCPNANLKGARLSGAKLSGAKLNGANLSGAYLGGADLNGADLSGADLTRASMSGTTNLFQANLSGATLTGAQMGLARLARANLSRANLGGANLRLAYLIGADLSGANLTRATLDEANLANANLTGGANLTLANLTLANLTGANLTGANLSGTNLTSTTCTRTTWTNGELFNPYRNGYHYPGDACPLP